MKLTTNSSLVAFILAASAAAAPQRVAGSDSVDHKRSDLPTVEEAVNQVFNDDQHKPVRRDNAQGSSDLPTVEEAVNEIFAANNDIVRRWDERPLEDEIDGVIKANEIKAENQVYGHATEFSCQSRGTSTLVSPNWFETQFMNKLKYLSGEGVELSQIPKSSYFVEANAGLDWGGFQYGEQGTAKHDWAYMTIAWQKYGNDESTLNLQMLKDIYKEGNNVCTDWQAKGGPRTSGFAAKYNDQWAFYLFAGKYNNKNAEKYYDTRSKLKWQKPDQVSSETAWDEFVALAEGIPGNPILE